MRRVRWAANSVMRRTLSPVLARGKSPIAARSAARRRCHLLEFATVLALSFLSPGQAGAVEQAAGGGIGALIPTQILDGPAVQLQANWRWRFLDGRLWLLAESGVIRTSLTAVTTSVPLPGGAARVRGDVEQWSLPLLGGLAWRAPRADGGGVELDLLAGGIIGRTRTLTSAWGVGRPSASVDVTVDPLLRARLEWSWPVRPGLLALGGGWQQHLRLGPAPETDLRATGPFLEAAWRVLF